MITPHSHWSVVIVQNIFNSFLFPLTLQIVVIKSNIQYIAWTYVHIESIILNWWCYWLVRTNSCSDCGLMANMGITLYYIMSNTYM
jgi:hypothetical protein